MKRLVLLGGGHAHLQVLQDLHDRPDEAVSVTLVTPRPALIYTGMLPGYIAGHYRLDECSIDLVRLASRARVSLIPSTAVLVSPGMREVICADGTVVGYDVLSCDIGSRPRFVKGAAAHAIAVRPLEGLVAGFDAILKGARSGAVRSVSMVGGGAGGVELAFAMNHRFRAEFGAQAPHVRIITNTPQPLPEFPAGVRRRLRSLVRRQGLDSQAGSAVVEVGEGWLRLESGLEFASEATVWAAGAGAPEIFRDSGLATDPGGFLAVNERLQSISHPEVFGAGDCATNTADPRPKAGVFAVRAAPVLSANLRAALTGSPLASWRAQRRFLVLISTGDQHAVGCWGPLAWSGSWAWGWKDRIDRRFVARFSAAAGG